MDVRSQVGSALVRSGQLHAQHLVHFSDLETRGHRLAGLPRVYVRFREAELVGELLLRPALRVSGLRDGDSEVLGHGWR